MIDPAMPASDDVLEEVLRPVALRQPTLGPAIDLDIDPDATPGVEEDTDATVAPALQLRPRHGRRASVPAWDEISARTTRHGRDDA
jgi:hypothetical protein